MNHLLSLVTLTLLVASCALPCDGADDDPQACGITCVVDEDCFAGWFCVQRGGAWQCVSPAGAQ